MSNGQPLIQYARRLLADRTGFQNALQSPVLIWRRPGNAAEPAFLFSTRATGPTSAPTPGESFVFEIRKVAPNSMVHAVTIGRATNNDVVIESARVSKFHAYLTEEGKTWFLTDAASTLGTWIGEEKLDPKCATAIADQAKIRVGDVELHFLMPATFAAFLESEMTGKAG